MEYVNGSCEQIGLLGEVGHAQYLMVDCSDFKARTGVSDSDGESTLMIDSKEQLT
jgi:hypothetical protein